MNRFHDKVDRSGGPDACWPWTAASDASGYGRFGLTRGRIVLAHRLAYELAHDLLPASTPSSSHVCHSCDNPPCCNPAHLWLGSSKANMADCASKGRIVTPKQWTDGKCVNGHDITLPGNTYRHASGQRQCRECKLEYARRYHAAKAKATTNRKPKTNVQ